METYFGEWKGCAMGAFGDVPELKDVPDREQEGIVKNTVGRFFGREEGGVAIEEN